MFEELFRKQAQEGRQQRLEGEVLITSPVSIWAMTAMIGAVAITGIATAIFGEYARKETVTGWLAPDHGMAEIVARQGGIVEAVHVLEGDRVMQGQALAIISLDTDIRAGVGAAASILEIIDRQRQELVERQRNLEARHKAETNRLAALKQGLSNELNQLSRSIELQGQRIRLAEEQVASVRDLVVPGYVSQLELQNRQQAVLSQRQLLVEYEQRQVELWNEIRDVQSQIDTAPLLAAEAFSELEVQLWELARQRTEMATRSRYVLTAPMAGQITAILAQPGDTVHSTKLIMTLLPEGGALQAQLFAPTRAVGFVQPGQEVRLLYDAFPYERYGAGSGTVLSVSKTILDPNDLPVDLAVNEPVYRIVVKLERATILAYGDEIPLQSGMLLRADIVFGRRALWEWMLDPFLRMTRR